MNCIALFVGNNQYEDIGKLRYAEQDATDLRKLFASIGWKAEVLRNAGAKEIKKKIRGMLKEVCDEDVFLFFFAGHGYTIGEGDKIDRCLVGIDDEEDRILSGQDGLTLRELKNVTAGPKCRRILILDACQTAVSRTRDGMRRERMCATRRDLVAISNAVRINGDNDGGQLIAINSCQEGDVAYELDEQKHGLFSQALLDVVSEHRNSQLFLNADFVALLTNRMDQLSGGRFNQHPQLISHDSFCLIPLYHQRAAAPTSSKTQTIRKESDQSLGGAEGPSHIHVPLAEAEKETVQDAESLRQLSPWLVTGVDKKHLDCITRIIRRRFKDAGIGDGVYEIYSETDNVRKAFERIAEIWNLIG